MSQELKGASRDQPRRPNPPRRRGLWVVLLLVGIGGVVAIALAVGPLRGAAPPPSASPLPVRTPAPASAVSESAHLQRVADLALSGGSSRFDYQSLDPRTRLLFIAHLGASIVTVLNTASNTVVADIPNVADVHGVLAIPELARVYASATGDNQIAVIDERTLRVVATIPGGVYPDGMAYDPVEQHLFVSDEAGGTETVIDTRTERPIATIPLGGEAGNSQYDPVSHRILVDVQTLNQLVAIDPATNRVLARYALPHCEHDHSLLIDAASRRAFVACDGNNVLLPIDLGSMTVLSVQTVGSGPDVLALDGEWHLLYVASESGVVSIFEESGQALSKVEEGFVASSAHSVAVDGLTHRVYLPLQDVDGKPVLRIVLFCSTRHRTPGCQG